MSKKKSRKDVRPESEIRPETEMGWNDFREMASNIIDDVLDVICAEYPDFEPKEEYLAETPDASVLYGEIYYALESRIEDKLKEKFVVKPFKQMEKRKGRKDGRESKA